jgi:hypothetical protein
MPATLGRRLQADRHKTSKYCIILMPKMPATLARRLQADRRKTSKFCIILMPSNASDAILEAPGRPAQKIKTQVSLQVSLHVS